jgi:uncharacterized protein YjdB
MPLARLTALLGVANPVYSRPSLAEHSARRPPLESPARQGPLPNVSHHFRTIPRVAPRRAITLLSLLGALACKEAGEPVPVATISMALQLDSVVVGGTRPVVAVPMDAQGNNLETSRLTWESGNTGFATVNASGVVTGVAPGNVDIRAKADGRVGSMVMRVQRPVNLVVLSPQVVDIEVNQTRQLTVTTNDANGQALSGRLVTFSTSNASIATVTSNGLIAAIALGNATITAESEGKRGTTTVNVNSARVSSISFTPPSPQTMLRGQTLQITATPRDGQGNIMNRPVTWSTSNQAVGTVSATGLVSAVGVGQVQITATAEGTQATMFITVNPVPPATVEVTGATDIFVGQNVQFTPVPRDAQGNALSLLGRGVQWQSSNLPIASVSANGVVTGVAQGSATITAIVDGVPGSAIVNVANVPVAAVTMSQTQVNGLRIGSSFQLVATPRDALGNPLSGRLITWSSSNNIVATVSSLGLVTANAVGIATITATVEGQSAQATVTVVP